MSSSATRFAIAVHVLTLLAGAEGSDPSAEPTSAWMASSIGVNPVIVRSVVGRLRRAGLVRTQQGVAGAHLARRLDGVTLLDVYRAVVDDRELFGMHHRPNPACPVGAHIQATLECFFGRARHSMEGALASATLDDVARDVRWRIDRAGREETNPQ